VTAETWTVAQTLKPGTSLRVVLANGLVFKGRLVEVRSDALVLAASGGTAYDATHQPGASRRPVGTIVGNELTFFKSEIVTVDVDQKRGLSKGVWVAIIGAVAGLVVLAATCNGKGGTGCWGG
jgi:hypothetical protein